MSRKDWQFLGACALILAAVVALVLVLTEHLHA